MRDSKLTRATVAVIAIIVLAVVATARARSRQVVEQGVSSPGATVYNEYCAGCHLRDAARWTNGPGLVGLFGRRVLPISRRPVTAANVLRQINDPFKAMPSFRSSLTEEQKAAVVAYLKTL